MPDFVSKGLQQHYWKTRRIRVAHIFKLSGWRSMTLSRFWWRVIMIDFYCTPIFWVWLLIRLVSQCLSMFGLGDGSFASSTSLRAWVLERYARHTRNPETFWRFYFMVTNDTAAYVLDYCAAWECQRGFDAEMTVCIDNVKYLAIPCSATGDDRALMEHFRMFYDLIRSLDGLFEFFGAKSSHRIEIVQLLGRGTVGPRVGLPLALGKYGAYGREVQSFKKPSRLTGNQLMVLLINSAVLVPLGTSQKLQQQQPRALNIVRNWDPHATSIIVFLPVILSLAIAITWSLVATIRFNADVQTSTQTGFTIGGYVVTAGALVIALIAFLDTKSKVSG